jgi:hypothetical protein
MAASPRPRLRVDRPIRRESRNLAMTVVIARMMRPTEFGISVLGASAFLILEAIRELASVNYLQQKELTRDKINSA